MPSEALKDVCVFVPNSRPPPASDAAVDTWFGPGRVVFIERLIDRRFTVERLFQLPFGWALMCVRDESLATFHVDMISRFDDRYHSVDILFSPWLDELDPASCQRIGLTIERLLRDGLTASHVRRLRLRLSEWSELFGMDTAAMVKLGITRYGDYFPEVADDLGRGGAAAGVPVIEL